MIPFHLSFPVRDLASTRAFYGDVLGCGVGRSAVDWIDFDFFGHQLSAHVDAACADESLCEVGGERVPLRHFGAVLPWPQWEALAERLRARRCAFVLEPHVRFAGEPGEQGTFFVRDPSGNALEFKTFRHPNDVFVA